MINRFAILTVLCVVAGEKWDVDSLRKSTNELDTEILEYYESLPRRLADITLQGVRDYLTLGNNTKIGIRPIDVDFAVSIFEITLEGEFKANSGGFRNLATIERRGDTTVEWPSTIHSVVSTTIGLNDLEVYFPHYEARWIIIQENGDVRVVVGDHRIHLQMSVTLVPTCTVTLTNLTMKEMSDISTNISGLVELEGLARNIAGWVLNSYETSLMGVIENVVAKKLSDVLAKTGGFCKYKAPVTQFKLPELRKMRCRKVEQFSYKCTEVKM